MGNAGGRIGVTRRAEGWGRWIVISWKNVECLKRRMYGFSTFQLFLRVCQCKV